MSVVLVLNADYSPLNVTSLQRGFVLVNKGKAEVVKKSDSDIITSVGNFVRPLIIRLIEYIRYRPKTLTATRRRIFKRDGHECQYCGSKRNLTIDHVIPRSKGGKNTWSNMVTCCSRCNGYKGDRTPSDANMTLKNKPVEPNLFSSVVHDGIESIWSDFQKAFYL